MSSMQITINLDGDAFQEDTLFEIGQVFDRIRAKLESMDHDRDREVFPIFDSNGNSVGRVELEEDSYTTRRLSVPQRIARVTR